MPGVTNVESAPQSLPQVPGSPERPAAELDDAFALLAEMTQNFATSMDLDATLNKALASIARHLDAQAGSLWLLDLDAEEITCRACVGPNPITGMTLGMTQGIIGRSVLENTCQSVFDVSKDPAFSSKADQESGMVTRSLLCAPMSFSDRKIGAIELINKTSGDGHFAEKDVHPLQVLASSAALAIANSRMAASLVEAQRVRRELELAAEIQRNLLPPPRPDPFPVQGLNIPARTVSGDFFDVLPVNGCYAFCLGDVSGKGINAALLMAKTASLYRCLAKSIERPGELLRQLNDEICETATRGMFVTMSAGVYDPKTGSIRLANAGHEPAVCHIDGAFSVVEAEAPPLGIIPEGDFPETELQMHGGSLYIFSDGLTEAETAAGDQLGREGLEALVTRFAKTPLAGRVTAIVDSVSQLELRDDLTLLAVSDEASGPE
jgi:sigma-B regulation protein RsbU (phosphoserine phosphatase)